jgi:tetratricopeptide (TPR) repeat protein
MNRPLLTCLMLSVPALAALADRYENCDQRTNLNLTIRACTAIIRNEKQESIGKRAFAYRSRGVALFNKSKIDRAIADFTQALGLRHNDARSYQNRGMAYYRKGEYDQALGDLKKAHALDAKLWLPYFGIGNVQFIRRNFADAALAYTKAIQVGYDQRTSPYREAQADYWRSRPYYLRGRANFKLATTGYKIRDINRGFAYAGSGDLTPAITDYSSALKIFAHDPEAYFWRARAFHDSNNFDRAIADYTKAIALKRRRSKFTIHGYAQSEFNFNFYRYKAYLGRSAAYRKVGQPKKAQADSNKAKEINRVLKSQVSSALR